MEFTVRYFLLCDDVHTNPDNLLRLDVLGLMTHIRSTRIPPFPVVRPRFCVLALLTGCEGTGELSLRIVQSDAGRIIFRNQSRRIQFISAPGEAVGIIFYINNCVFPAEGLYWVEFIIEGAVAARQALSLTS